MKLKALFTIKVSGKKIPAGTIFDSEDIGLVRCGAAQVIDQAKTESTKENDGGGQEGGNDDSQNTDVDSIVRNVLADWLEQDPEQKDDTLWTKNKTPRNSVLDKAVGENVSADKAKQILDEMQSNS